MSHFSEITIYYFSGTGNSANVAHWISEMANKQAIPVKNILFEKNFPKIFRAKLFCMIFLTLKKYVHAAPNLCVSVKKSANKLNIFLRN